MLDPDKIPTELRCQNIWVNWTVEEREGKPTKIPINPSSGRPAQSNNPETWGSFEQAYRNFRECENDRIQGVGVMFNNGNVGVDIDHCRNPETGTIEAYAKEIIATLNSYTEISPSGTGIHTIGKGQLPKGGRRRGSVEMYDRGRYFTVTGNHLPGTPLTVESRQAEIAAVHKKFIAQDTKKPTPSQSSSVNKNDAEILSMARRAANGAKFARLWSGDFSEYPSQSEADLALCLILAFWTGRDPARIDGLFRQSGLMREKWDEKHFSDGRTYGESTIQKAIEQTTEVYSPAAKSIDDRINGYEIGVNLTDLGNARRLVSAHGRRIRYCFPWRKWISWDGKRWVMDDVGGIIRRAKETVGMIYKEASEEHDKDRRQILASHALKCESDMKLKAMIELAKSEPGIPVLPDDLDRDPWVLNVKNGTLNLITGELSPHSEKNLITKLAPVDYLPGTDCPYWKWHLNRIMDGNPELINFLQKACGYSLNGVTDERVMMILYGSGSNGKTTTVEAIARILGDYATSIVPETLLVKREGSIPNDVAGLKGSRFVFCCESEEGKRLSESLIKSLTGGDTISARFMRGEWFNFVPTFKIWFSTNHKPVIRGTDNGIWNRIRLVPFTVSIPFDEIIPKSEIEARFEAELPGIFAWMVEGAVQWHKTRLQTPAEVKQATDDYRADMDTLGDFIKDKCDVSPDNFAKSKDLYDFYKSWCNDGNEKLMSKKAFGLRLAERGFIDKKVSGDRGWKGIGIK